MNKEFEEDELLDGITESLAEQINVEMEKTEDSIDEESDNTKKRKLPKWIIVLLSVLGGIVLICMFLFFTKPGQKLLFKIAGNYIYSKLDYDDDGLDDNNIIDATITPEVSPTPYIPVNNNSGIRKEDYVTNILLLGVEEIEGARNTDVMIIASLNTRDKTIKLTSLMRDIYVELPDTGYNKLNAAFARGGIQNLYKVIEDKFHITIDGYMKVNFEAFQQIVDLMGGINITLSSKEAYYLNTTNYISNPAYRNLREGSQWVNGNQALGYCRIREVSTATEGGDFGRTQRHRLVLESVFNKCKSKNLIELGILMNNILSKVDIKTDIAGTQFNRYLEQILELKIESIDTFRIPSNENYKLTREYIGSQKLSVVKILDWDLERKNIQTYIYGDYIE